MRADFDFAQTEGRNIWPNIGPPEQASRPRLRMLISSAGRRVGLMRAFRASAGVLGVDLEIFATDVRPEWSSACVEADFAFAVPPATSPDFIDAVLALCQREAITLIVPTIDTELQKFAEAREQFAAIGTLVAVSDSALVEIARDKLATAQFLSAAAIPSPRTAEPAAVMANPQDWEWPLLAKPRHGSSGRGIRTIRNQAELVGLEQDEAYIVQTVLRGREFTINLYFDNLGRLCSAVPHERRSIRGGEVEKGFTVRNATLCDLARRVGSALHRPFGALCFQAFLSDDGQASIFEINARFGGGYPLAHHAGATFARWLIEQRLGLPTTANDRWQSGVVMLRYDDAVFV